MMEKFDSPRSIKAKRPPPAASPGPQSKSTAASMAETSTRMLIDPRTSSWIGRWDAVTSVALIFVAFVTPFEVALLDVGLDPLFFINRIVDSIFVIDMMLCFVTVYTNDVDVWITDPTAIAVHYLKGWFPIDLISVGISGIDVYVVISERIATQSAESADDDDTLNSLRTLRIVRVLRFFRVVKLVRLVRAARIFARWENKIAINYNTLQLVKSVTAAVVVSHWIACMWITQAFMQGDMAPISVGGGSGSWLQDSYPYCYTSAAPKGYDCKAPGLLYVASLYHTTLCLFGGLEATAGNGMEMLMGTLLMLISGLVWSHVMATVIDVVTVSDPEESAFRATMDSLNTYEHRLPLATSSRFTSATRHAFTQLTLFVFLSPPTPPSSSPPRLTPVPRSYMRRERIPPSLRCRAREYFNKSKHVRATEASGELLELMPGSLQADFVLCTSAVWIPQVCSSQRSPLTLALALP